MQTKLSDFKTGKLEVKLFMRKMECKKNIDAIRGEFNSIAIPFDYDCALNHCFNMIENMKKIDYNIIKKTYGNNKRRMKLLQTVFIEKDDKIKTVNDVYMCLEGGEKID